MEYLYAVALKNRTGVFIEFFWANHSDEAEDLAQKKYAEADILTCNSVPGHPSRALRADTVLDPRD